MKSKIKIIISSFLIIISSIIYAISLYIKNVFGNAKFEQLLLSLLYAEGTSGNVIIGGIKYCIPIILIIGVLILLPIIIKSKKITYFKVRLKNKSFSFQIFPFKQKIVYSLIIFVVLITLSLQSMGLFEYIKNQTIKTKIFDDYYINPQNIKIEFPEKKQNLIYIYLESMEMSYNNFQYNEKNISLIPNLASIARKNINFSNNDSLGGASSIYGTSWTIAAIVSQSAGIPLKLNIDGNTYDHYTNFLPGITTIGDILYKEGYNQVFMIGSDANFAGRSIFFNNHGGYEIKDYYKAKEENIIDKDYFEFWGYEDKKLFEYAKKELLELSKKEEPFNFTMLTVDTHAIDGYLDETCKPSYDYRYANVINCSDTMISKFIQWIEKQDFYKNTTIVLVGDHLTMQSDINDYIDSNSRTIYNSFINSKIAANNTKNRIFTSFDMFPTTLASLGVKIEGDRLGLGTNLFSNRKTLAEELGIEYLNNELTKRSTYYNLNFLQGTYYEMLKETEEDNK